MGKPGPVWILTLCLLIIVDFLWVMKSCRCSWEAPSAILIASLQRKIVLTGQLAGFRSVSETYCQFLHRLHG